MSATARRVVALALVAVSIALLGVAALAPLRAAEIAELDAEAGRLAEEWIATGQDDEALAERSNAFFLEARALEPPIAPLVSLGGALLVGAAAIALWPPRDAPSSGAGVDDGDAAPGPA